MLQDEIEIRLAGEATFVYTVRRLGSVIETGTVELEEEVVPGYYGGSMAMD